MNELIPWLIWVLIPALVGFIVVFLWHYFRDPYVKVLVKNIGIDTYGYYAEALSQGGKKGDKEVYLEIVLIPTKIVEVTEIILSLSGKHFKASELSSRSFEKIPYSPKDIENKESYIYSFHIPKDFAVNTKNAQIIAIANRIKRHSKPFSINFLKQEN